MTWDSAPYFAFWIVTTAAFGLLIYLHWSLQVALWKRVILGLIVGVLAGLLFGGGIWGCPTNTPCAPASAKIIGDAFVQLVRMLVVPLIFSTVVAGVVAIGEPRRLRTLGLSAVGLYIATTIVAVCIGIALGLIFRPGIGVDLGVVSGAAVSSVEDSIGANAAADSLATQLLDIIPENPVAALARSDLVSIIFWSLLLGVGILLAGSAGRPLASVFDSLSATMLKITVIVMELAPYGTFALMAWVMSTQGLAILTNLAGLALVFYLACFIHIGLTYGSLVSLYSRLPFRRFLGGILDAQSVAYSTASSSATLPVTISNVSRNLGVDNSISGSVLPLGATVNMDGTSIYLGLVAVFTSQALQIDLQLFDFFMIATTAAFASIGAAALPSAGLLLATTVLGVIGVSSQQAVLVIALIYPFDRLLDMMRTATNITGDAAVAVTIAKRERLIDEEIYRSGDRQ